MKCQVYKKRHKGLILLVMAFMLFGCTSKPKGTYEEVAKQYLDKTYKQDFVVEKMARKGMNEPFPDKEYSGSAYIKGQPTEKITVWVDKDKKTFHDTYYTLNLYPEIKSWIKTETSNIWKDSKSTVVLDVYDWSDQKEYTNIFEFFKKEYVNCNVYVMLSQDDVSEESFLQLSDSLYEKTKGNVYVFVCSEEEMTKCSIEEMITREYDYLFRIGSFKENISKLFK